MSLTGIKPTGAPHLGNFVGAIRPAVALAETYDAFYFIADYHALTSLRDPAQVKQYTRSVAASWLACGLDPARAVFYRQSDVPETFELAWILACVTPKGMMNRAHAYKAAVDRATNPDEADAAVNMGLFNYPILMAADILIMDADVVPVGADQMQHIEYTRDLAERLNTWIGDDLALTVPSALAVAAQASVAGLDGRKMSKSYDNAIPLFAGRDEMWKLLKRFKTDSVPLSDPKDPDSAIVELYDLFATPAAKASLHARLTAGGLGWGHVKQELLEVLDETLRPLRKAYSDYLADPAELDAVLARGADRARERADAVLGRVRVGVGTG